MAAGDVLEKSINEAIALKLQQYLEQGDCTVLMTRVDDSALGNSKVSDMEGRREIVNTGNGDILVSIHQNSFTQASVVGPQVFYYDNSGKSKVLAECVQQRLTDFLGARKREAKSNDAYYMLKQTEIPAVIVECGFLSNDGEKNLLLDEKYQQKVAWAIYTGIVDYVNDNGNIVAE